MVKADPQVTWLWVAIGLRVGLFLLILAPLALVYSINPSLVSLPLIIVYPLIVGGYLVYQIVALVGLNGQEQRRRAAAASSVQGRLALAGQPMPALPPLPMPFTLRLRPNWTFLAGLVVVELILLVAFYAGISYLDGTLTSTAAVGNSVGVIITPALFVVALVIAGIVRRSTQRIDVNPYGITIQRGVASVSLYWETIMLFAQVRAAPARREVQRISLYELSNMQSLIRFAWPHNRWAIYTPQDMTQAQYDQWMQLLLNYISVRAGLPLVDVR